MPWQENSNRRWGIRESDLLIMEKQQNAVIGLDSHPDFDGSNASKKVVNTAPDCPGFLSRSAREHWADIVPQLTDHRIINALDKDVLSVYCSTYALFVNQDERLTNGEIEMIAHTPKGYPQISADYVVWRDLGDRVMKLAKQLGLTPPARVQLRLNSGDEGQTDLFEL